MKIPTKIKIGETEYKVNEKKFYFNDLTGGSINFNLSKIVIRKTLPSKKEREAVFFHEIAHGILKELEFNHPKISPFRSNEVFVQELGLVLRKTFLDLFEKQEDLRTKK